MKRTYQTSKQDWKRKIRVNLKQQRKQRAKEKREKFQRIYDRKKTVMFKSKKQVNTNKHFLMPKLERGWALCRSKNALAVYPVLCSRADFMTPTPFQLSRENIAKLAGISPVTVDKGINDLEAIGLRDNNGVITPLLEREMIQDEKRRYYTYLPGFFRYDVNGLDPKSWRGNYFQFYTCIVESGVWASLSRKAKALYLAMRSVAWFDREIYYRIECVWIPDFEEMYAGYDDLEYSELIPEDAKELYRARKWEVCDKTLKSLFELAQIPYSKTREIVNELEQQGLVERLHDTKSIFQVWLRPK